LHDLLALMVIGLVLLLVGQRGLQGTARRLRMRAMSSFGYGLVIMLLAIPAAILLALATALIVGIVHLITLGALTPLVGVLLVVFDILLIGVFWLVAAFVSRLVVCYVLGQWLG